MLCHICAGAQGGHKRASDSLGTGARGSYELPDVDAGNRTQVLWKNSKVPVSPVLKLGF